MFAARKTSFFCDRWNINKPTPTATQLLNQPNPRLIDISFAALWVSNMAMCQQLKFISLAAVSLFQTPHCPVFQNPWPKAYHPRFIQEQFHHLHMSFLRWSKQKHQQKTCKHHKKKCPKNCSLHNFSPEFFNQSLFFHLFFGRDPPPFLPSLGVHSTPPGAAASSRGDSPGLCRRPAAAAAEPRPGAPAPPPGATAPCRWGLAEGPAGFLKKGMWLLMFQKFPSCVI